MGKNDRLRPDSTGAANRTMKREELGIISKNRSRRSQRRHENKPMDVRDDNSMSSSLKVVFEPPVDDETEPVISKEERELETWLETLYEKRGSRREKALSNLVDGFANRLVLEFVENRYFTFLLRFVNLIKRGSSKEASLASRAISLLAITVDCGSYAHEIMEESILHLYEALKSGSDSVKKSSVLDCLAVITFVGGEDVTEKENVMKMIWDLIHPKSSSNVTLAEPTSDVLASALSAWSLLLSSLNPRSINSYYWQESMSFLSTLLDKDDCSVRIAAGEAIALIFDIGKLDKFTMEDNGSVNDPDVEGNKPRFAYVESLKGKFLNQARNLSVDDGGKGSVKNDLDSQQNAFQDILTFVETGVCPKRPVKIPNCPLMVSAWTQMMQIPNCPLMVSTWTQMMQLNFLRRFLGNGFIKHMQDNELRHDIFDFTQKEQRENFSEMGKMPISVTNRGRTKLLNKLRTQTQERKLGHFRVGVEDD